MTASTTRLLRRPRLASFIAATAIILAGSYGLALLRPSAAPPASVPGSGSDSGVSAPISPPGAAPDAGVGIDPSLERIDDAIATWSAKLEANPNDFLSATNLAALLHGRGGLTLDLGDHERALVATRTALTIEPGYAPARALEASILFTLHDFTAAHDVADRLVRDDPSQFGAMATRFDAALELGRLDEARADLERLRPLGGPAILVREARLASAIGDPTGALDKAQAARAAAIADESTDLGFYAYAEGEYARLAGDASTARAAYEAALAMRGTDLGARIGLARIDAFDGNEAAAIAGLRAATGIAPQPESLALLGDLLAMDGDPGATATYETVRFIEQLGDIQSSTYDRVLLRFELDHDGTSEAVLTKARASLAARPDWTGHDTVAWALYRLGRLDEAAVEIEAARALGADDARLRFHDGAIEIGRGNAAGGRALLTSALALGPALDPIERAEAERLLD